MFDLNQAPKSFSGEDAPKKGLGELAEPRRATHHLPHEVGLNLVLGCLRGEPNPKPDEECLDVSHRR